MQLPCWNRACVSAMSKKHIKDGLLKSLHTHTRLEKLCILQWKCIVAREIYLQSSFPHCFHRRTCCAQNWSATATPHLSLSITETQPDPTVLLISLISRRIPISNLCFFGTGGLHFTTLQTKKWHIGSPLWFPLRQTKYDLTAIVSSWLLTHPQNKAWELEL